VSRGRRRLARKLDGPERRTVGIDALHERQRDVEDGDVAPRSCFRASSVSVAVEDHVHGVARQRQRLLEPARAEKRRDLGRLALHRAFDRGVVEDGDPARRA